MMPRVGVDVGGTFTDVTLVTGPETLVTAKVPTTADQSKGVLSGIQQACAEAGVESLTAAADDDACEAKQLFENFTAYAARLADGAEPTAADD